MTFQATPYHLPLVVSAVMLGALGVATWRQRRSPVAQPFFAIAVLAVLWVVIYGFEIATRDLHTRVILAALRVPVISLLPVAGITIAFRYAGRGAWLTPRRLVLLSTPASIAFVLALTSEHHTLWRYDYYIPPEVPVPVLLFSRGPVHWVNFAWGYALVTVMFAVLLGTVREAPALYTRRAALMLGGLVISLVPHALFDLGISPLPGYNIAPSLFGISGAVYFWGTVRHRVLQFFPTARSVVVDHLRDPVFVLDERGRIVDANRAAEHALGLPDDRIIGHPAAEILGRWGIHLEHFDGAETAHEEVTVQGSAAGSDQEEGVPGRRILDVTVTPITRDGRRTPGRLIVVRDVTERELAREAVHAANALEAQREAEERTRREIAELLHGRVQTQLLLLFLQLRELEARWPAAPPEALALIRDVRENLDRIREREVRAASHRLYPTMLELGLTPAIHTLAERFEPHLDVSLDVHPDLAELDSPFENRLPMPLRETAYRVIEEALANVQRHAAAKRVRISLALEGQRVVLRVRDDGAGLDPAHVKAGLGLRTIAGRAGSLGGDWRLDGAPGEGATLTVELPLAGSPAQARAASAIPPAAGAVATAYRTPAPFPPTTGPAAPPERAPAASA